jgi:hypothetical protein
MIYQPDLSPERRQALEDFARRLAEKQAHATEEFRIPPELLQNDRVRKMLENEEFLDWIASNQGIQRLIERWASKYRFPESLKAGPSLSPAPKPAAGNAPLADDRSNDPIRPTPDADPSANKADPGIEDPTNGPPTDDRALQPQGSDPTTVPPGDGEGPSAHEGRHSMLKRINESLRNLEPLQNSKTLDRVDQLMGVERVPATFEPAPVPMPTLPEAPVVDDWLDVNNLAQWQWSPWVAEGTFLPGEVTLPPGWDRWALPVDRLPLPSLPSGSWAFSPPMPALPSMSLPSGSANPRQLLVVGVVLASVAILILLLRSGVGATLWARVWPRSKEEWSLPMPTEPLDANRRDSVLAWFEYVAYRRQGSAARHQTHVQFVDTVTKQEVSLRDIAHRWAQLYEQARYSPPGDLLDPHLAEAAPRDLAQLKDPSPATAT